MIATFVQKRKEIKRKKTTTKKQLRNGALYRMKHCCHDPNQKIRKKFATDKQKKNMNLLWNS